MRPSRISTESVVIRPGCSTPHAWATLTIDLDGSHRRTRDHILELVEAEPAFGVAAAEVRRPDLEDQLATVAVEGRDPALSGVVQTIGKGRTPVERFNGVTGERAEAHRRDVHHRCRSKCRRPAARGTDHLGTRQCDLVRRDDVLGVLAVDAGAASWGALGTRFCGSIRGWGQPAGFVVAALQGSGMTRTESRAEIGALGEQMAVDYLQGLGLRVLERNWRCRYGELDIIAVDDAARAVVFVEVKTRTSEQFGGVAQAVTPVKVRRLRRLAGLWLAQRSGHWAAVRIDVVTVRIGRRRTSEITHIQGVG